MPSYTYRCSECGDEQIEVLTFAEHDRRKYVQWDHWRAGCPGSYHQVLSLSFHRSLPEHFNNSIGSYVTNSAALNGELSRKSDEMSERMGFAVKYETVDPRDTPGVTESGLEATEKRAFDTSTDRPKKLIV